MKERAYKRLQYGEPVAISEMGRNGDDLVQALWELKHDVIKGQYTLPDFDNKPEELILERVNPLPRPLPPEHERLTRDMPQCKKDITNPLSDEDRLALCRAELSEYGK